MTIVLATVLPAIRIHAMVIRTASALQIGVALVLFLFADRAGSATNRIRRARIASATSAIITPHSRTSGVVAAMGRYIREGTTRGRTHCSPIA